MRHASESIGKHTLRRWSARPDFSLTVLSGLRPASGEGDDVLGNLGTTVLLDCRDADGSFAGRARALQEQLYAHDRWSLLLIFQAMDAAGKDSAIKHVMSGVNPQGCVVHSFKSPSSEELDHDFLWRCLQRLPERGRIGIFNRSY